MNTYEVKLRYTDRQLGDEGKNIKVEASSISGAIGKATREFIAGLDRKQKFDANKGLRIEAARVSTDKTGEPGPDEVHAPEKDTAAATA